MLNITVKEALIDKLDVDLSFSAFNAFDWDVFIPVKLYYNARANGFLREVWLMEDSIDFYYTLDDIRRDNTKHVHVTDGFHTKINCSRNVSFCKFVGKVSEKYENISCVIKNSPYSPTIKKIEYDENENIGELILSYKDFHVDREIEKERFDKIVGINYIKKLSHNEDFDPDNGGWNRIVQSEYVPLEGGVDTYIESLDYDSGVSSEIEFKIGFSGHREEAIDFLDSYIIGKDVLEENVAIDLHFSSGRSLRFDSREWREEFYIYCIYNQKYTDIAEYYNNC